MKILCRCIGISLFFILGNRGIINLAYKAYESKPVYQNTILTPYDYGVILGGGFAHKQKYLPDRIIFKDHINRLTEAMELYASGKIKKIIFTGGIGGLTRIKDLEANDVKEFLEELKWPDSSLIIENKSRNTYENAIFTKAILDSIGFQGKILLITSAAHMPRAERCFKKAGVHFDVYPADYQYREQLDYLEYILPNIACFYDWEQLIKEWIGTQVYSWKGYL